MIKQNNKNKMILTVTILLSLSLGENVRAADLLPDINGKISATGGVTAAIDQAAINIKSVYVAGGSTLNTGASIFTLNTTATNPSQIVNVTGTNSLLNVNNTLNLNFKNTATNAYMYSLNAENGGVINLFGDNNTITSQGDSNRTDAIIRLAGNNSQLNATGNSTTVTAAGGKTRLMTVQDGAEANFQNGLGTSVFYGISNSSLVLVQASTAGKANFDLVDIYGTGYSNGRMFYSIGQAGAADQAKITFLGGNFNTNAASKYGATALEATTYGEIEALGYADGELNISTKGDNEAAIIAVSGGSIKINTGNYDDFVTTINTVNSHGHGIAAGVLEATGTPAYDSTKYGNSSVEVNGTIHIDINNNKAYGLKVAGDGAVIRLLAAENQAERSTIDVLSTAVKFSAANGYSTDSNGNQLTAGGQVIEIQKTDISTAGVFQTADADGIYTGNLIQVGSHDVKIVSDGQQNASSFGTTYSSIIDVADAVKNATLTLVDSTATAFESTAGSEKDLINVTYGGGATGSAATIKVASDLTVNAADGSVLTGSVFTDYTEVSDGSSVLKLNLSGASEWNITRNSTSQNYWQGSLVSGNFVTDLTVDNATVNFKHLSWTEGDETELAAAQAEGAFKTLYVAGDYTGKNGLLKMNVVLGDDDSSTDRMVVGGNTSGTTYVNFTNIGGEGAKTAIGIEVISVDGTSAGTFLKDGALVGGLYEYQLVQGGSGGEAKNWYLTSNETYRPDGGSYLSNLSSAGAMFDLRLYDREAHITTAKNADDNLWMINTYSRVEQNYSTGQFSSTGHLYRLRLGTDFTNEVNERGEQKIFGIMGAYGRGTSSTYSAAAGRSSRGKVDGYLLGLYGTYFEEAATRRGWYADSWFQYGWFDNEVYGEGLEKADYDSKGWSGSLEVGKTILDKQSSKKNTFWQPKGQVIYSKLKNNAYQEANGTLIEFPSTNNWLTRLGIRWLQETLPENRKEESVYVELNWLHNTKAYGIASQGDYLGQAGNKNLGEIRLGFEKEARDNLRWWGNIAGQFGAHKYRGLQGMVTMEYLF